MHTSFSHITYNYPTPVSKHWRQGWKKTNQRILTTGLQYSTDPANAIDKNMTIKYLSKMYRVFQKNEVYLEALCSFGSEKMSLREVQTWCKLLVRTMSSMCRCCALISACVSLMSDSTVDKLSRNSSTLRRTANKASNFADVSLYSAGTTNLWRRTNTNPVTSGSSASPQHKIGPLRDVLPSQSLGKEQNEHKNEQRNT